MVIKHCLPDGREEELIHGVTAVGQLVYLYRPVKIGLEDTCKYQVAEGLHGHCRRLHIGVIAPVRRVGVQCNVIDTLRCVLVERIAHMRCVTVTKLPDKAVAAFREVEEPHLLVVHIHLRRRYVEVRPGRRININHLRFGVCSAGAGDCQRNLVSSGLHICVVRIHGVRRMAVAKVPVVRCRIKRSVVDCHIPRLTP